jgi:hypothetical protein
MELEFSDNTSDIWSSKTMMAFMALTIHFLSEDFDMHSFNLEVEQIDINDPIAW